MGTLLGAPLITGKAMDDDVSGRSKDLAVTIERLTLLYAEDVLILSRDHSAPIPSYITLISLRRPSHSRTIRIKQLIEI